ncbi:MAG: hypothetical protein GTO02_21050 [Candidatus Dadabacteria bacterium]|nr:hypothetical protein [Candidatus Dadabacteria bacterium]
MSLSAAAFAAATASRSEQSPPAGGESASQCEAFAVPSERSSTVKVAAWETRVDAKVKKNKKINVLTVVMLIFIMLLHEYSGICNNLYFALI